jgi:hypothetical protein
MFLARTIIFLAMLCGVALAQTSPGFIPGKPVCANYPSAECPAPANPFSLNQAFQLKSDYPYIGPIGSPGVVISGMPAVGYLPFATGSAAATWAPLFSVPNIWTAAQAFSAGATVPTQSFGDNTTNAASTAFVQNAMTGGSVASPAALASAVIPVAQTNINVLAMASSGTSTCSLNYTKGSTSATGQYQEVLNAPSGFYWEPLFDNAPVRACQFGTVADATFNNVTDAVTGTDNTTFIQNALDYAMINNFNAVCLSDGNYKTTDTIQQGWGQSFYSINIVACNLGRQPYSAATSGVAIYPTMTDRCAINIQGGRQSKIQGIAFIGQNYSYNNTVAGTLPYPVSATGWLNPALAATGTNPGGLQRSSPYCAICIDCYAGNAPSAKYPTVPYPSWTGVVAQYNKNFSSDILLADVETDGFAVGISQQPNSNSIGGVGNGDFVKIERHVCLYSTYCVSIAGAESRAVNITNASYAGVFTYLTNNTFGQQEGVLGGPLSNISGGQSYQGFQIGALSFGFPVVISNSYGEAMVRLGTFAAGGSFGQSVEFDGGQFNSGPTLTGVVPAAIVEVSGTQLSIHFKAFSINQGNRIDTLVHGSASVSIDGGVFDGAQAVPALNSAAIARAVNYTGSVLVGNAANFPTPSQNQLFWYLPTNATYMPTPTTTGAQQHMGPNADFATYGARALFTQATTGFVDDQVRRQWTFLTGPSNALINISSGGGYTSTGAALVGCDGMTFTLLGAYQTNQSIALTAGDMLYHLNTGTSWVVTVVGSPVGGNYPITTQQMNNMNVDNTGACTSNNISDPTVGGNTVVIKTGFQSIPEVVEFGDFANGSTTISNVNRGDGYGGNLSTYVNVGDQFWTYSTQDNGYLWPYAANSTVATVTNGTPGTLTLSAAPTLSGRFPILPVPVASAGYLTNAITAKPAPAASGGTCAAAGAQTGNQVTGTIALSGACAATNTVTLTFAIHAPTAWACGQLTDQTAPTILFPQTGKSATTAVFTAQGTSGAADVLSFHCDPY